MSTSSHPDGGGRHEQPREVDLGQDVLLADQALPALAHAGGEERPRQQPGEDEHRIGQALGRDLREPPEDDREDEHRQQGLEHRPGHAEHRLLVADLDVAPDQEKEQLAGVVQLLPVDRDPARARPDDDLVGFRRLRDHRGRGLHEPVDGIDRNGECFIHYGEKPLGGPGRRTSVLLAR